MSVQISSVLPDSSRFPKKINAFFLTVVTDPCLNCLFSIEVAFVRYVSVVKFPGKTNCILLSVSYCSIHIICPVIHNCSFQAVQNSHSPRLPLFRFWLQPLLLLVREINQVAERVRRSFYV